MKILKRILAVIVGYILVSLINMGIVLTVFGEFAGNIFLVILMVSLIVPVTSYLLIKLLLKALGQQTKTVVYLVLILVLLANGANAIFGLGVEPLYYKLFYMVILSLSVVVGVKKLFVVS